MFDHDQLMIRFIAVIRTGWLNAVIYDLPAMYAPGILLFISFKTFAP